MAHCTECGTMLQASNKFCGGCGTPAGGAAATATLARPAARTQSGGQAAGQVRTQVPRGAAQGVSSTRVGFVPGAKTPEGQKAMKDLKSRIRGQRWTATFITLGVPVVDFLGYLLGIYGLEIALGAGLFVTFATFCVSFGLIRVRKSDYDKLPGTRDANGDHRCFHCGNRGIYRHTPYKSNITRADCSKCRENLWTE